MPRQVLEFRVVIASPNDVYEHRTAVFEALHELNRSLESQKISVRAMGWEEYSTPGISHSAQDLINTQLLKEYDILIALIGTKLGSPTRNAASGTVEEIEHAIANNSDLGDTRVQVYFLNKIDNISSISIDDLVNVRQYKDDLATRGILYRPFTNAEELQKEVRANVYRSIANYCNHQTVNVETPPQQSNTTENNLDVDPDPQSLGSLDHLENAQSSMETANSALTKITSLINQITDETNTQVNEIQQWSTQTPARVRKTSINNFAKFLTEKSEKLTIEASLIGDNFLAFSQSVVQISNIQREDNPHLKDESFSELLDRAEDILSVVLNTRSAVLEFRRSVEVLPRITIQFNKAKKLLLDALDECLQMFDKIENAMYKIASET